MLIGGDGFRELGQLGLQLHNPLLGLYLGSEILLHTDKVGELIVLVKHGGDRQFVPEMRAVLSIIAQYLAGRLAAGNGFTDQLQADLI